MTILLMLFVVFLVVIVLQKTPRHPVFTWGYDKDPKGGKSKLSYT